MIVELRSSKYPKIPRLVLLKTASRRFQYEIPRFWTWQNFQKLPNLIPYEPWQQSRNRALRHFGRQCRESNPKGILCALGRNFLSTKWMGRVTLCILKSFILKLARCVVTFGSLYQKNEVCLE